MSSKLSDQNETFDIKNIAKDPILQFDNWIQSARKNSGIKEPNAMCLSTSTKVGKPSSRIVTLRDFSEDGFCFYTNYGSKKGQELDENPQASLCFYWDVMSRQIRIDGKVVRMSREKSIDFFSKKPLKARISTFVSDQSKVIKNKERLVKLQQDAIRRFEVSNDVPMPENWGGFCLIPEEFEFWQSNESGLHDRLRFRRVEPKLKENENEKPQEEDVDERPDDSDNDNEMLTRGEKGWIIERLAP